MHGHTGGHMGGGHVPPPMHQPAPGHHHHQPGVHTDGLMAPLPQDRRRAARRLPLRPQTARALLAVVLAVAAVVLLVIFI